LGFAFSTSAWRSFFMLFVPVDWACVPAASRIIRLALKPAWRDDFVSQEIRRGWKTRKFETFYHENILF